jgi:hypothetical protein
MPICSRPSWEKVEGEDALVIGGPLEHPRMAQRANGVVAAGAPMLPHAGAGDVTALKQQRNALKGRTRPRAGSDFAGAR